MWLKLLAKSTWSRILYDLQWELSFSVGCPHIVYPSQIA
jgi:hypothetical protein